MTLDPAAYRVDEAGLLTPALAIYPAIVRHNIQCMIRALGGEPSRWRPHLKTVKLEAMMKLVVDAGVTTAKCATTLELLTACRSGFSDVLVAYPHSGRNAQRVASIAAEFPGVRISALVESDAQVEQWTGTAVELFIDINPGMNRTGIERDHPEAIRQVAFRIRSEGLVFRGLHFYDGNSTEPDFAERTQRAQARYAELLGVASFLENAGIPVPEIVTAGTPALPCVIPYEPLWKGSFRHQVSPGTVVYNDSSSLKQLPAEYGFQPAVIVISRVISHPKTGVVTCDAGHKSVSVDSGVPNCLVLGHPGLEAQKPSEEHLPFALRDSSPAPGIGDALYLLPRHVCPTVNNFDRAALVENGAVTSLESVSARGREGPL